MTKIEKEVFTRKRPIVSKVNGSDQTVSSSLALAPQEEVRILIELDEDLAEAGGHALSAVPISTIDITRGKFRARLQRRLDRVQNNEPEKDKKELERLTRGLDLTDPLRLYLQDIWAIPVLTGEDEQEIGRRMAQANSEEERREWRNKLVHHNQRLAVHWATRGAWFSADSSRRLDRIQQANLGIMQAADNFDYTKGFKFSTYASWWMKRMLNEGEANQNPGISITTGAYDSRGRIAKARRELAVTLGREPTRAEVIEAAKVGPEVRRGIQYVSNVDSLNRTVSHGHTEETLGDRVAAGFSTEAIVIERTYDEAIRNLIGKIPDTRKRIIAEALIFEDGITEEAIGERVSLSKERVRQLILEIQQDVRKLIIRGGLSDTDTVVCTDRTEILEWSIDRIGFPDPRNSIQRQLEDKLSQDQKTQIRDAVEANGLTQVLIMLAQGKWNKEISKTMGASVRKVEKIIYRGDVSLAEILGTDDRYKMIARGYESGLIRGEQVLDGIAVEADALRDLGPIQLKILDLLSAGIFHQRELCLFLELSKEHLADAMKIIQRRFGVSGNYAVLAYYKAALDFDLANR